MSMTMFHPRTSRLMAFASSELEGTSRSRVVRHLASCSRCRTEITAVRSIESDAKTISTPIQREDILAKVLARRAQGERLVLPHGDELTQITSARIPLRRSVQLASAALAASILLAIGWFVMPSSDAGATANGGELSFSVLTPHVGQGVRVSYAADSRFRAGDGGIGVGARRHLPTALVLRAKFRHTGDDPYRSFLNEDIATLTLGSDGRYHGSFVWPDSAVYAAFAVEDSAADIVDSHHRAMWSRVAAAEDGRPSESGLEQKANDLMYQDWRTAYGVARERERLYPASLNAWNDVIFYEISLLGTTGSRKALASDRARLVRVDAQLRNVTAVTSDDEQALLWIARTIGDSARTLYWQQRLVRDFPANPKAVEERVVAILIHQPNDPHAALTQLEALWKEVGPAHRNLMLEGLFTAATAHDSAAVRIWGERLLLPRKNPGDGDDGLVASLWRHHARGRCRSVLATGSYRDPSERLFRCG